MRVLLTGFEPFDGQLVNASWSAVEAVAAGWTGPAELCTVELPVSFVRAPRVLRAAMDALGPDVVVCVGEAGGRSTVGIERVAVNVADAEIADNDGLRPTGAAVVPGGPAGYGSGLPLRACLTAALAAGGPVEISDSAGTYVCNAVFYVLMGLLADRPGVCGGFVHVPRTPEQVSGGGGAMTTWDATAILMAVLRAAGAGSDDGVAAAR